MTQQNVSVIGLASVYLETLLKMLTFYGLEPESDSKSPLSPTTKLNIEASYKGIELVFPISRENYYELIEGFQNKKVKPSFHCEAKRVVNS